MILPNGLEARSGILFYLQQLSVLRSVYSNLLLCLLESLLLYSDLVLLKVIDRYCQTSPALGSRQLKYRKTDTSFAL